MADLQQQVLKLAHIVHTILERTIDKVPQDPGFGEKSFLRCAMGQQRTDSLAEDILHLDDCPMVQITQLMDELN